jgi:hypothetical protein
VVLFAHHYAVHTKFRDVDVDEQHSQPRGSNIALLSQQRDELHLGGHRALDGVSRRIGRADTTNFESRAPVLGRHEQALQLDVDPDQDDYIVENQEVHLL